MNSIDLYMYKKISENDLLKYLNSYFNENIVSLNNLESNGELFLQYDNYNGDINVGITISWPLDQNKNFEHRRIAMDLAKYFQTNVLFCRGSESDDNKFNCIDSNGIESIVTLIDDSDAVYIDCKHNSHQVE